MHVGLAGGLARPVCYLTHIYSLRRDSEAETESFLPRKLKLQFLTVLSLPVFTGTRIEGEDCNILKVALTDSHTGKTVSTGTESSSKVEIVVLEGDFGDDMCENWTVEEFNSNIVKERRGKKPLLSGNSLLNLKDGIGLVGDLCFSDNSSWTRSRKFRLGARVLENCDDVVVKEAVSEPFIVRDHRGELYKKHHPPYLCDEVWRLEKISKDGAFHKRLNKENVKTVKDFLLLLFLNPARLRHILGPGMSTKMWEVVVEHAARFVLDDNKLYLYCPQSQKRDGVAFNVVGQVLGLLSDGKYAVFDELSETEKAEAHKLVLYAFQNVDKVLPYDDEASLRNSLRSFTEDLYPVHTRMMNESPKVNNAHPTGRFDYPQMNQPSPDTIRPTMGDYGSNHMDSIDLTFDQPMDFECRLEDTLVCDPNSSMHLQYLDHDLQHAVDRFLFPCPAMVKAQRRWKIVSSVVKWFSLMLEIRKGDVTANDSMFDRYTQL